MRRHDEVMKHFMVDTYYVVYSGASSVRTPGNDGLLYSRFRHAEQHVMGCWYTACDALQQVVHLRAGRVP